MAAEDRLLADLQAVQARMQELSFQHYRAHYKSAHRHHDVTCMLQSASSALAQLETIAAALDAPVGTMRPVASHIGQHAASHETHVPLEEALAVLELPSMFESLLKSAHGPALDDAYDLLRTLLPSAARLSTQQSSTDGLTTAVTAGINEVLQHGASADSTQKASAIRIQGFAEKVADVAAGTCQSTMCALSASDESALLVPDLQAAARNSALRGRLSRLHRAGSSDPDSVIEVARSVVSECSALGRGTRSDTAAAAFSKAVGPFVSSSLSNLAVSESLTKLQQSGYNGRRLARDGCSNDTGVMSLQTSNKLCSAGDTTDVAQFAEAFNSMRHVFPAQAKLWILESVLREAQHAGPQNANHILEAVSQLTQDE